MPFLNLDFDYFDHPKTTRLVGLLGNGAEILPIRLWTHIAKFHASDGKLVGYSPDDIERIIRWSGKPGEGVDGLLKVGFIERNEDTYQAHDWDDHQGHIHALKIRNKKVAKNRWKNIRNTTSTVDTSGIPKSTTRVPLSFPFQSFPKELKDKEREPPEKPPADQPQSVPKQQTNIQKVVRGFQIMMKAEEDPTWNKVYFRRFSRPAHELLTLFHGDVGTVLDCVEAVSSGMEKKHLSWTPETIIKHASDWKNGRLLK